MMMTGMAAAESGSAELQPHGHGHDEADPYCTTDFGIDHLDHFLSDFQMVF